MVTNTKKIGVIALSFLLAFFASSVVLASPVHAYTAPSSPFKECPPVGYDSTGCGWLLVINPDGSVSVYQSTTDTGPYDGVDDTLVGVLDQCSACGTVSTLTVTGSGIGGFDGDGPCSNPNPTSGLPGAPAADCYGGVNTFTDPYDYSSSSALVSSTGLNYPNTVVVTLTPGLTNGGSAWFGLETALSGVSPISVHLGSAPQFGLPSAFVTAISILFLGLYIRIKKPFANLGPATSPR